MPPKSSSRKRKIKKTLEIPSSPTLISRLKTLRLRIFQYYHLVHPRREDPHLFYQLSPISSSSKSNLSSISQSCLNIQYRFLLSKHKMIYEHFIYTFPWDSHHFYVYQLPYSDQLQKLIYLTFRDIWSYDLWRFPPEMAIFFNLFEIYKR